MRLVQPMGSRGGRAAAVALGAALIFAAAACDGSPSHRPPPSAGLDGGSAEPLDEDCPRPEEGCACEDGAAPVTCYLPTESGPGGYVCQRGTLSCRDGTWSACESIHRYVLRYGTMLISEPMQCDPCRPDCFETVDRPTDGDLDDDNSYRVEYDPDLGGIRIISSLPPFDLGGADCGDGIVEGLEQCDDGNRTSGDGCSADCRLENGWVCPTPGEPCRRTVCGDGVVEGLEQCDDGNLEIGDGCTPFCRLEPDCSDGPCEPVCGDGQLYPGQECDDGNTLDGDGCSSECTIEEGWECETVDLVPDAIDLPIVYRDFRMDHPDFENWCCGLDEGMVEGFWGPDRKPVPVIDPWQNPSLSTADNFYEWYNDADSNITIPDLLTVTHQGDGTYVFDSGAFFPIDNMGWALYGEPHYFGHNFHFTSETRFWFIYERGQRLDFRGDDDVWVFINGRLAVDIGGVHGPLARGISLDEGTEGWLGLTPGQVYEAAVFHAERHTEGSNYRLSLAGFFFERSECEPLCGDGIVTEGEVCDDGVNDGSPGSCTPDCQGFVALYEGTGRYWRDFDATETCDIPPMRPDWGELSWDVETPSDSIIRFEIRTASTESALPNATPVTFTIPSEPAQGAVDVTELLNEAGRVPAEPYLRITVVFIPSSDGSASPVLRQFNMQYTCRYAE
jgi:fibro-slime domain-containing protein